MCKHTLLDRTKMYTTTPVNYTRTHECIFNGESIKVTILPYQRIEARITGFIENNSLWVALTKFNDQGKQIDQFTVICTEQAFLQLVLVD